MVLVGVYSHPHHPKPRATSANIMNITLVKGYINISNVIFTGERKLPRWAPGSVQILASSNAGIQYGENHCS